MRTIEPVVVNDRRDINTRVIMSNVIGTARLNVSGSYEDNICFVRYKVWGSEDMTSATGISVV